MNNRPLIAIPVYNEARHVRRVVDEVRRYDAPILLVDDASTDETPEILDSLRGVSVLRHEVNRGYGQSLIDAFDFAEAHGHAWVITMDADGQHEAESLPDFFAEIATGQWDMISGSRYLAGRDDHDLPPMERRHVNFRITRILNDLFGMELTDSFCGFKAHRTASMIRLGLTEPGYAFPLQLWPRVWEQRLRMKEIGVRRVYNDPNRSFGVALDDADVRLAHYLDVLNAELLRMGRTPVQHVARQSCRC